MTKQKDPFTLLEAIRTVAGWKKNIRFLMIGDGELKPEVEELVRKYGLENDVILDGFRTDVPDVLHAIDVYCLPSLWEGLPIGLIEAMSMKKTAIATNVDGTKEVITDGVNGFLIKPYDSSAIASLIEKIHTSPELLTELGEAARKTIIDQFNVQRMSAQTQEVYVNVLNNKLNIS